MSLANSLTTACVLEGFSEEIAGLGGHVKDSFDDGDRLFVRSILPAVEEVRTDDRLQGGVALRASGEAVCVHPYVFRLVCKNGAIMAHAIASRRISVELGRDPEEAVHEMREAVRACGGAEVFGGSLQEIRSAGDIQADLALNMLPLLARMRGHGNGLLVQEILKRFFEDGDRTRFGFMNAVTSVARDTVDPQVRWNLEELGGGIPVDAPRSNPKRPARSNAPRREVALVS
jgi:hypothetical protein